MRANDAHEALPVWTPGAWLAGFITWISIHCYTQIYKSSGPCSFREEVFLCFSHSMGTNDQKRCGHF